MWLDIIPYQELLGNYNVDAHIIAPLPIIPYQELLGNYNLFPYFTGAEVIIPYQELLGNYNEHFRRTAGAQLYHTKNC